MIKFETQKADLIMLEPLRAIEVAARDCYASFDKVSKDSHESIARHLFNHGHMACLEFGVFYFKTLKANTHLVPPLPFMSVCQDDKYIYYAASVRVLLENPNHILAEASGILRTFGLRCAVKHPVIFKCITHAGDNNISSIPKELIRPYVRLHTNRAIANELVRHRYECSYAQESTRWIKYGIKNHFIFISPKLSSEFWYRMHCRITAFVYRKLRKKGRSAQFAREVLSLSFATRLNMLAPMHQWSHIFKQRISPTAHPYINDLMLSVNSLVGLADGRADHSGVGNIIKDIKDIKWNTKNT